MALDTLNAHPPVLYPLAGGQIGGGLTCHGHICEDHERHGVKNVLECKIQANGLLAHRQGVLLGILLWRRHASFKRGAWAANVLLMTGGLLLFGYQLSGYVVSKG